MRTKKQSIATRTTLIFLVMVLLSTLAVGGLSLLFYRADTAASNAQRAKDIAETVAAEIDGDQFRAILNSGEKNEYWQAVKASVDDAKKRTGVLYLSVLDKNYTDKIIYFMEGYDPATATEKELDLLSAEDAGAHNDELYQITLRTGESATTDVYDSEGFGTMVSGYAAIKNAKGGVEGAVAVDIGVNEVMNDAFRFGLRIALIILGCCVLFGFISMYLIKRTIGKPIAHLKNAADKLALGDLNADLSIASNNEIGQLAASFRAMAQSTKEQAAVLERLAGGDLTIAVAPRCKADVMSIALQRMIDHLNGMFQNIYRSTAEVTQGSAQIADGAQNLAQGSTEQAVTIEKLAESMSAINSKTEHNARMAEQAKVMVETIRAHADTGAMQMQSMLQAVRDIDQANKGIGKVLHIIEDIASQTNILALNAAVEAARAGAAGKGFAVVAEEVRTLAAKSANSAKDSATLIDNSVAKAALGVRIAGETSASLSGIAQGVNESVRIITTIVDASEEQKGAIEQINMRVSEVAQIVQQNSATSEQSAAASEHMRAQAEMLEGLLREFKLK